MIYILSRSSFFPDKTFLIKVMLIYFSGRVYLAIPLTSKSSKCSRFGRIFIKTEGATLLSLCLGSGAGAMSEGGFSYSSSLCFTSSGGWDSYKKN